MPCVHGGALYNRRVKEVLFFPEIDSVKRQFTQQIVDPWHSEFQPAGHWKIVEPQFQKTSQLSIERNKNIRTVQSESSKFASLLFDQIPYRMVVGTDWNAICIHRIVPGFVVYYLNIRNSERSIKECVFLFPFVAMRYLYPVP